MCRLLINDHHIQFLLSRALYLVWPQYSTRAIWKWNSAREKSFQVCEVLQIDMNLWIVALTTVLVVKSSWSMSGDIASICKECWNSLEPLGHSKSAGHWVRQQCWHCWACALEKLLRLAQIWHHWLTWKEFKCHIVYAVTCYHSCNTDSVEESTRF